MASTGLRKELECSICMSVYTDPVTLRCGHSFCRDCINNMRDTDGGSGVYLCPECRATFRKWPPLQRSISLCNVVENFLSTPSHQEQITWIRCTYCIHSPVLAVRSCLHCEASLCDNHLSIHSKGPEHVLTDPSTSLENRKCSVHKKILEYYCTEDAACICASCGLTGEHQGHQVEMLEEASEKKKKKLRNVLQKLITKRKKTEERVQSVEERRRKAQEKTSEEAERVTALFIDIRKRVDDLEKNVLCEISRWKEKVSLPLSDVIQKLEIKKNELYKKVRHIEELCNTTDPLTVLQELDTGDLCDPEEGGGDEDTGGHDGGDEDSGGHNVGDEEIGRHGGGDEDTGRHDAGDEDLDGHDGGDEDLDGHDGGDEDLDGHDGGDEDLEGHDGGGRAAELISHISLKLTDIMKDINVTFYILDPEDILLDVITADNNLLISDDLKTATWTEIRQNRPETLERFKHFQVMSSRRFTSGRHYWDVEISRSYWWRVGMCYPSIDRRGRQSFIGDNKKSWSLYGGLVYNNQYSVIHDREVIPLHQQISSDGVRICLDYEAGQLSFYELCDPIRHLHTFTTAFSEPLHAAICVYDGSIVISGRSRCEEPCP